MAERDDGSTVRVNGLTKGEMIELIEGFTGYLRLNTIPPGIDVPWSAVVNFVEGKFAVVERFEALEGKNPPHNGTIPEAVDTHSESVLAYWALTTGCDPHVHLSRMATGELHQLIDELATLLAEANEVIKERRRD